MVTARVHVSISLCVVFPCSRVCCVGVLCIVEGKIYTRSIQTLTKQFDITYENTHHLVGGVVLLFCYKSKTDESTKALMEYVKELCQWCQL